MANFFKNLSERIQGQAGIRKVYGDPIETQGKTIIPVAKVVFGYGFGGSQMEADDDPSGVQAGGGGAGANITPLGVMEVSEKETRFIPAEDWRRWGQVFAAGFFTALSLRLFLGRKKNRKS